MNIETLIQLASRQKFRFQSIKGELTTEQLWDLPLTHRSGFSLDEVAKQVNGELRAAGEESFVQKNSNSAQSKLEAKLEIVKLIISAKLEEAERAIKASQNQEERQRLLAVLNRKQDAALEELTPEQLQARLAELEAQ